MPGCRPLTGESDNVSELINVEVSVYGRSPRIDVPDDAAVGERHPEPSSLRDAFFSEYGEHGPTAVYDAAQLQVGATSLTARHRRGVDHDRRLPLLAADARPGPTSTS